MMYTKEALINDLLTSGGLSNKINESLRACPNLFNLHQCIIRIAETDQFRWIVRPKRYGDIQQGVGEIKRLIINERIPGQSSCIEFIQKLGEAAEVACYPTIQNRSKQVVSESPSSRPGDTSISPAREKVDSNSLYEITRVLSKSSRQGSIIG